MSWREGPVFAIKHPEPVLQAMDDWNTEHHQASGLWQRVIDSKASMSEGRAGDIDFSCTVDRIRQLTLMRQQYLPGPALYAPPDAGTGTLVSLPQSGCQQSQGTGCPVVTGYSERVGQRESP